MAYPTLPFYVECKVNVCIYDSRPDSDDDTVDTTESHYLYDFATREEALAFAHKMLTGNVNDGR